MKILALSDQVVEQLYSPSVKERFGDVSLVVGCGDLPSFYLEFVVSMLNVPLIHIPGNHDPAAPPSDVDLVRTGSATNIDGQVVEEQGLLIAGLGGSIRYRPDGVNQYTQGEMRWRILSMTPRLCWNRARRGRYLDILVTHAPPRGIHDAEDPAHVGFAPFNRFMARFRPRYLLHGHSHLYRRDTVTRTQVGSTTVINVFPFRVIDLAD
jgi:Icc-related predicted phosphoesterase